MISKEAKEAGADIVIRHNINKGVGAAFQKGVETALKKGTDVLVTIDADGQFDTEEIEKILKPILDNKADMVTGTRFQKGPITKGTPWIKKIGNKLITHIINILTHNKFTDTQCEFRAYTRDALLRLNIFSNFTYTQKHL